MGQTYLREDLRVDIFLWGIETGGFSKGVLDVRKNIWKVYFLWDYIYLDGHLSSYSIVGSGSRQDPDQGQNLFRKKLPNDMHILKYIR